MRSQNWVRSVFLLRAAQAVPWPDQALYFFFALWLSVIPGRPRYTVLPEPT
jgi:hypothetical protein